VLRHELCITEEPSHVRRDWKTAAAMDGIYSANQSTASPPTPVRSATPKCCRWRWWNGAGMKVFYHAAEQGYRPAHSFFGGRFTYYPEIPERTRELLSAVGRMRGAELLAPPVLDASALEAVHGAGFLRAVLAVCERLKPEEQFFPQNLSRIPLLLKSQYARVRMGYYAIDTSTPLLPTTTAAALGAAACAAAAAQTIIEGERLVYALARPPGHHAGKEYYAGYCIFNNGALAAERLLTLGKVAVLDVDFHHGNGTQDIFYERDDVLYASLHCRPEEAYPYVAGAADETGSGKGRGFNLNLPLPGGTAWSAYRAALEAALERVATFAPAAVVVSLGFDTLAQDPIGAFKLNVEDFAPMAQRIRQLGVPLLVLQEGGYHVPSLAAAALGFFGALGIEAVP
jgi:acetoin utilization deacetylase AcuC-like enzyme